MTSDDYLSTGAMRLRRSSNKEDKRLDKGMLRMQAGWAVQMLEVWGNSVAVIDEVDIVRALSLIWHLSFAVGTSPLRACTPPSACP
jgi:hypothetical protein